jgi:hypothetical protein
MTATAPTFESHIKPLFRESDRTAMLSAFDLWSFDDVSSHSAPILGAVESGSMPCDGPWSDEQVDLLRRWIDGGTPEWGGTLTMSAREPSTRAACR